MTGSIALPEVFSRSAIVFLPCDLYDGCLIYDFSLGRLWVVDLDTYHRGPFTNQMGRMFGSSRFMASEELELGATIDWRTTVFTLGRFADVFIGGGGLKREQFRGSSALFDVVAKACDPDPDRRFRTVAEFGEAWKYRAEVDDRSSARLLLRQDPFPGGGVHEPEIQFVQPVEGGVWT